MNIKVISVKDTERIAKHMKVVHEIISKLEDKYGDITFNSQSNYDVDSLIYAASGVERLYNNYGIDFIQSK